MPKAQDREPQVQATKPEKPEPKPNPNVEAPAFVWVNKGYDPRKPNPGREGESGKQPPKKG